VPTWNYIAVHVYGTVKVVEGEELREALSRLMDTYERHMPHPLTMGEIPEKKLNDDLRGIVGFEISIDEVQAAYKLSQNRDPQSYHQVVEELDKGDEVARKVAEEMKRRNNTIFGA
jgi:transcriptional regulator